MEIKEYRTAQLKISGTTPEALHAAILYINDHFLTSKGEYNSYCSFSVPELENNDPRNEPTISGLRLYSSCYPSDRGETISFPAFLNVYELEGILTGWLRTKIEQADARDRDMISYPRLLPEAREAMVPGWTVVLGEFRDIWIWPEWLNVRPM